MNTATPPLVPGQSFCFACGAEHPHGLRLQFRLDPPGSVVADWIPSAEWMGFQGIVHGGIIATVLDEAMSKAVVAAGIPGLTCRLEIRLHRSIAPGDQLTVKAWVTETRGRRIQVESEIRDNQGQERAQGRATFLTQPTPNRR